MPRLERTSTSIVEEVSFRSRGHLLSGRLAYPEPERCHGGLLLAVECSIHVVAKQNLYIRAIHMALMCVTP